MKPITLLTALLVMLRVAGLAEIPWGWVFAPIIALFACTGCMAIAVAIVAGRR